MKFTQAIIVLSTIALIAACAPFNIKPATATATLIGDNGKQIGSATFQEVSGGVRLSLRLNALIPGRHGTHLHLNPSCTHTKDTAGNMVKFGGAGPHFDPMNTMMHGSPYGAQNSNHAGDLENTLADEDGDGYLDMTARRVTIAPGPASIIGHSIVIHANEDQFTNEPANGGSGARIACGVIVAG